MLCLASNGIKLCRQSFSKRVLVSFCEIPLLIVSSYSEGRVVRNENAVLLVCRLLVLPLWTTVRLMLDASRANHASNSKCRRWRYRIRPLTRTIAKFSAIDGVLPSREHPSSRHQLQFQQMLSVAGFASALPPRAVADSTQRARWLRELRSLNATINTV